MKGQLDDIKETMQKSENTGMKTFDSALFELAVEGKITQEEALKNADSANNLRLRFKLSGPSQDDEDASEMLMRGQLPSDVAAAKAAEEAAAKQGADDAGADESPATDIHAAMAAQLAGGPSANDVSDSADNDAAERIAAAKQKLAAMEATKSSGPSGGLELSLEPATDPEPEPGEEEDDPLAFGMGKVG